jgi:cytidine deaminase
MAGEAAIEAVVAVRQHRRDEHPLDEAGGKDESRVSVVSPCGLCRELLFDHAPGAAMILPGRGRVPLADLLPAPYRR